MMSIRRRQCWIDIDLMSIRVAFLSAYYMVPASILQMEAKLELDRLADEGDHEKEFKLRLHSLFHDLSKSCEK